MKRKDAQTPTRMNALTKPHSERLMSSVRRDSGAAKDSMAESKPSKSVAVESRTKRNQRYGVIRSASSAEDDGLGWLTRAET